ncbi:hypothetical protein [Telmatospirillum sp.]|uniref:hypothetical protein n=1 Tax=Telmatospirillum sp. TaxID=2079197 RepID=UPI00284A1841|nr:hypothetical protein [Telmatospirillum sp.]MDR3434981.1 hypothetical protein [Telmatospirillum sp.]
MIVRPALLACFIGAVTASQAVAAPFCVQLTGIPLQCLYVDPTSCQQEANRTGGRCAANPAEFVAPVSTSQYCLVGAGNTASCVYPDQADCNKEAIRQGGACIAATQPSPPGPSPRPGVDLYEIKRP